MPSRESIANYPPAIADLLLAQQGFKFLKVADDGAAGTATAETALDTAGGGANQTLRSVVYIPSAALTGDNANNATLIVGKRTAGGSRTTLASIQTTVANGNWTAFVPVAITISTATFSAGDVLTFEITKAGSGVVVPKGVLVVAF